MKEEKRKIFWLNWKNKKERMLQHVERKWNKNISFRADAREFDDACRILMEFQRKWIFTNFPPITTFGDLGIYS